ncbi:MULTISPECIES: hypothetical protein [unclassified Marinovum]
MWTLETDGTAISLKEIGPKSFEDFGCACGGEEISSMKFSKSINGFWLRPGAGGVA